MFYGPTAEFLTKKKRGETMAVLNFKYSGHEYDVRTVILDISAVYNTTLDTNPVFRSIFRGKDISKIDNQEAINIRKILIKHGYRTSTDQRQMGGDLRRVFTAEGIPITLEYRL
jgi:hypothetical protein